MTPTDRAIVAAAEERDRAAAKAGWLRQTDPGKLSAHGDRHELLRIVGEQDAAITAALNELGVPGPMTPAPIANAVGLLRDGKYPDSIYALADADGPVADRADAAAEGEFLKKIGGGL